MELRTSDFCAAFVKQAGQASRRISGSIVKDILEIIAEQRRLGKSECAGYLLLWAKYCVLRKYIAHIAVPLRQVDRLRKYAEIGTAKVLYRGLAKIHILRQNAFDKAGKGGADRRRYYRG